MTMVNCLAQSPQWNIRVLDKTFWPHFLRQLASRLGTIGQSDSIESSVLPSAPPRGHTLDLANGCVRGHGPPPCIAMRSDYPESSPFNQTLPVTFGRPRPVANKSE